MNTLLLVLIMAAATVFTRFLPFWVFPPNKPTPAYIVYLGKVLPCAVIGLLVVYCLKGVDLTAASHGLPEFLGVAATAGLHLWKRNTLLSIGGGTILYMVLVQLVFH